MLSSLAFLSKVAGEVTLLLEVSLVHCRLGAIDCLDHVVLKDRKRGRVRAIEEIWVVSTVKFRKCHMKCFLQTYQEL